MRRRWMDVNDAEAKVIEADPDFIERIAKTA
jgi:hypothetical protein